MSPTDKMIKNREGQISVSDRRGKPEGSRKTQFRKKYEWLSPCDTKRSLRLPALMAENLPEGWQEKAREAIFEMMPPDLQKQLLAKDPQPTTTEEE